MARSRKIGEEDLTTWMYEYLISHVMPDKSNPDNWWHCFAMNSGVGLEEAWHKYGEEVLKKRIADRPGFRPWPWWLIDAPSPRRRLVPDDHYWPDWKNLSYGIPANRRGSEEEFETQTAYLSRLNLLTKEEKTLLKHKIR